MSEIQNVETLTQPAVESRNSFEAPAETLSAPESIEEKVTSPEVATTEAGENKEAELPEFAKRRLGREQKKHERELARVRAELEQERARNQSPQPNWQYDPRTQATPVGNGYQDPITGKYIDITTPEGQAIYNYQQEMSHFLSAQERAQQERAQKEIEVKRFEHFQDSFEDAKEKYSNFETVIKGSGMNSATAQALADFPDPGELGYYLASNPREVERLQRLPAYEMKRELVRHMADMVSKNNITKTPAPVKAVGGSSDSFAKPFAHKSLQELKAERSAQLSGQSPRGRRR